MKNAENFIPFVQSEFKDLAESHRMREVYFDRLPILKRVIYSNGDRMVSFSLDLKDGFISCDYGPASFLLPTGQPAWPASELLASMNARLRREGIDIPEGVRFKLRRVPEVIRTLIDGVRRHEASVFGSGWDGDGS